MSRVYEDRWPSRFTAERPCPSLLFPDIFFSTFCGFIIDILTIDHIFLVMPCYYEILGNGAKCSFESNMKRMAPSNEQSRVA